MTEQLLELNINPLDSIVLPIDAKGEILSTPPTTLRFIQPISKLIRTKQLIQDIFDIPDWAEIQDLRFPLKHEHNQLYNILDIFSLLPRIFCRIIKQNDGSLSAVLYQTYSHLEIDHIDLPTFLFNHSGRLAAFNRAFFALFPKPSPDPGELLGKSMDNLFIEPPFRIFNRLLDHHLSIKPAGIDKITDELTPSQPDSLAHALKTLPKAIEFPHTRLRVRMDYSSDNHLPPVFMIGRAGYQKDNDYTPDQSGLSIGPDGEGKHIIVKWRGWLLYSCPWTPKTDREFHAIELIAADRYLFCGIDGETALSLFLFGHQLDEPAYFNIAARPGSRQEFRNMEILAERMGPAAPLPQKYQLMRFKAFPDRYYQPHCISNHHLNRQTLSVNGLILNEVTPLQAEAEKERDKRLKLYKSIRTGPGGTDFVIGESPVMKKIASHCRILADTGNTILLCGPTGTGKEVVAHYIHQNSPRAEKPLIRIDCSTLPSGLVESTLFGHARGSFTGAIKDTMGLLERADGGTAFIDEIQNLDLSMQAKFLHVLQDGVITRVGETTPRSLDVRFIVASNQNLEKLIRAGRFREDLYYRINMAALFLPSLKDRKEDIPELGAHFVDRYNRESGKAISGFHPSGLPLLLNHDWPGNVRELKSVVTRACIFTNGIEISGETLSDCMAFSGINETPKPSNHGSKSITQEAFLEAVKRHKGRVASVARELGIARNSVYYNLRRFKADLKNFRKRSACADSSVPDSD